MSEAMAPKTWEAVLGGLQPLMEELLKCSRQPRKAHMPVKKDAGVYLFSEKGRPLYVGQARNLSERFASHTRPSSRENQASFAFLLALEDARRSKLPLSGTRKQIAQRPRFVPLFDAAKTRVRAMDVQFALTDDPELRTVFEVYATLKLGTRYNSFETH